MAPVLVYSPYNSPRDGLVLLGSQKRATQKSRCLDYRHLFI